MRKIGSFIEETKALLNKQAFIPASALSGRGDPAQVQAQQGQPGAPQQGSGLMEQVQQQLQQLPPEIQQQGQQALQQIQQMPPEQQEQALQQISQGINEMMSGQGGQPQEGQAQPNGQTPQPGQESVQGHIQAENQLDNTKVTLSVRELMDITSGGGATKSLLAVKQLADSHNQKMQANQQKAQQAQQQAQVDQQAQQQASQAQAQSGGLYATPPDASGKMAPPPQNG